MGTETKYAAAVSVDDGLYEVVVASKDIKPYIGDRWLWGIDPKSQDDGYYSYRLAIPEGTPEGSVILIKGRPGGGEDEIYRLFQTRGNRLQEICLEGWVNSWSFDKNTGSLTYEDSTGCYQVHPDYYGYCQIVSEGWSNTKHHEMTTREAGVDATRGPGTGERGASLRILNQLIHYKQRADQAETAFRQIAEIVCGQDLLERSQRGALTSLVESPQPTKRSAIDIVSALHGIFSHCKSVLTDLCLPDKHLRV